MTVHHFEILVEELSMEAFLRQVLPKLLGERATFEIYAHQGKHDLLRRLDERLRGYARWLPSNWRIVVIVDRDDENCLILKEKLREAARASGLKARNVDGDWQVAFRIAVEELEAWYFGEWVAVMSTYSRVDAKICKKAAYRICDGIAGGTWEAFERELQKANHFLGGLQKVEAARSIGANFEPSRCASISFWYLRTLLQDALDQPSPEGVKGIASG